jgi:branched-chain amino acid transport system ATP-binding protein
LASDSSLVATKLTAGYGPTHVLRDVSVSVHAGEAVALLGVNGAGKTTMLRSMFGEARVFGGTVMLGDINLLKRRGYEVLGVGVVHVAEDRALFPRLTVLENLMIPIYTVKRLRDGHRERVEQVFEMFPVLAQRSKQQAGNLSGGEQQMLALGRALMCLPRVLLLDEPTKGLSPLLVRQVFEWLHVIRAQSPELMMLLVEQRMKEALGLADRGYVLHEGRITREGSAGELLEEGGLERELTWGIAKSL